MSKYPECEDCMDTGEVFTHADDCADNFCALNADFYSCTGQVVPCHCPAGEEMRDPETEAELDAELLKHGVTPEMVTEKVTALKLSLGLPAHCRNVRCGIAGRCTCAPPRTSTD